MALKIAVLYGSTRRHRQGIKAARFVVRQLEGRGHEATLLDAKELDLPMLDLMFKEYPAGQAPPGMQRGHDVLEAADAYVVVGGEWNHSVPPALKSMLDTYQQEFHYKPAGIVSYSAGPFGGVRAAPHYRIILGELGMVTISILYGVSHVGKAFDADGADVTPAKDHERRIGRFLNELEWYTHALREHRRRHPDPMQPCGDREAERAAEA